MATYRTIAASEMDADSPLTTQLMTAMEANPTAIAEGAIGAPRIRPDAMAGCNVGETLLFKSRPQAFSGTDALSPYYDGDATSSFRCTTNGIIRVSIIPLTFSGVVGYRIMRDGVQLGLATSGFLTVDVAFGVGHVIWVQGRGGSGSGGGAAAGSISLEVQFKTGVNNFVGGI